MSPPVPITVFTGFLGAGKTTLILRLLSCLPPTYNVVLLKNEFGDVKVDSELAREGDKRGNLRVTEMLNGCMCCVLVGQMKNALEEIRENMNPSRIIIETSGSAFPAPIAWQIRELGAENYTLDGIVTVIDCENFPGYEDTSYTARLQAQYTDLILLNKHSHITPRQLDLVLDLVNDLNTDTPKVLCDAKNGDVDPDLVFGIDTKLFELQNRGRDEEVLGEVDVRHMEREVVVMSVSLNVGEDAGHSHAQSHAVHTHDASNPCTSPTCTVPIPTISTPPALTPALLTTLLSSIPPDEIYRIKGLILLSQKLHILNWAFGRLDVTPVTNSDILDENKDVAVRLTVMGCRGGEVGRWVERIREGLGVPETVVGVGSV
ncbi:cobW-domain-containing protein [Fimicolochytrium jonesii]|uniref:cobW-domain-containing protein n=1 Tax=Fimicolochytrium jonesii TaxID=1396493 RepID=UPI0022FE9B95|nr:cobW-domain-containing protein [Fimicolochytrium jonesii]KAI8816282.1 cobW-domain-containing protein [Fimicolochytrium jonesii]